jgi:RNA polymerase sigma-70 factor (ECF subfamily)
VALSNLDRDLLRDCLDGNEDAWKGFCDRFIGLIIHTVQHVASSFRIRLDDATRDDLVADVFLSFLEKDLAVLRRFRGDSSLASYLVVVARRTVIRRILQWKLRGSDASLEALQIEPAAKNSDQESLAVDWNAPEALRGLSDEEASAIRMFHLEGKSYREIGSSLGIAENSIGPFLTRARQKLRRRA